MWYAVGLISITKHDRLRFRSNAVIESRWKQSVELNETMYELNMTYALEFKSTTQEGQANQWVHPWCVPNRERDSERAIDTDNRNLGIPEVNLTICRYSHPIKVNIDRKIIPKPISELNKTNEIIKRSCHGDNTVLNTIPSRWIGLCTSVCLKLSAVVFSWRYKWYFKIKENTAQVNRHKRSVFSGLLFVQMFSW